MITEKYDLVIIGAGICGLSIGRALTRSSINFKIFEKSKSFGGRMATRRLFGQSIDHGTQYFTITDKRFLALIEDLEEDDIVRPWANQLNIWNGKNFVLEKEFSTHYICPDGMTAIAKKLASVLPVSREVKIVKVNKKNNLWHLSTDGLTEIYAETLICTAPLPQSLKLFKDYLNPAQEESLKYIEYNSCLSGIFVYPLNLLPVWKGIFWNSGNILSWVCNDSSKRDEVLNTILIAHCTPEFSKKYFYTKEEEVCELILKELSTALPEFKQKPKEMQLKKWLYSQPKNSLGQSHLKVNDNLYLAGDWCFNTGVEGAFLSGLELVESLLKKY